MLIRSMLLILLLMLILVLRLAEGQMLMLMLILLLMLMLVFRQAEEQMEADPLGLYRVSPSSPVKTVPAA